ncbi:MAG TPA: hypothetical protein VIN38_02375 [Thiobacillus sp.]
MSKKTLIASAIGTAFVASMTAAPIASAAENPFALSGLSSGYQVADNHGAKPMEGKCGGMKAGEGKCGGMKAGEGKCGGMSMMDANKDGKVSKEEFIKGHESMFDKMDANKDGFLDSSEMGKMHGMAGGDKAKAMEGKCGGMKK